MTTWQNRIVGHEMVDPDQLLANPANFRIHPKFQQDALEGVLDTIGWIDEITVNKRTQFVVDGHLRVALAITRGEQVPVKYVDLTEDEEALALAEFDYISSLAGTDTAQLDALLQSVNSDNPAIQEMLAGLAESAELYGDINGDGMDSGDMPLDKRDIPDAIFPTDNDYEIPLLRLDLQARSFDLPFSVWGTLSRQYKMNGGTYAFYTDDYRFNALWTDPTLIVNSGVANIVEPNFSCYETMPVAIGIYQVYRKRWLARWSQDYGVRIFVDLNVAPKWRDINLMGVPKGWRAYCTRSSVDYIDQLDEEYDLACMQADSKDILFLVYGGGKLSKELCKKRGWLWINDQQTVKKTIYEGVNDGE